MGSTRLASASLPMSLVTPLRPMPIASDISTAVALSRSPRNASTAFSFSDSSRFPSSSWNDLEPLGTSSVPSSCSKYGSFLWNVSLVPHLTPLRPLRGEGSSSLRCHISPIILRAIWTDWRRTPPDKDVRADRETRGLSSPHTWRMSYEGLMRTSRSAPAMHLSLVSFPAGLTAHAPARLRLAPRARKCH